MSNKKVNFKLADFDETLFEEQEISLLFCNMGLQWSQDIACTLKNFYRYLTNSRVVAFSLPLEGTLKEMNACYVNPTYKLDYIHSLLNQLDFEVLGCHNHSFVDQYNSPLDSVRSIRAVGANCLMHYKENDVSCGLQTLNKLNNIFKNPSCISLTYNIGTFVAIKY